MGGISRIFLHFPSHSLCPSHRPTYKRFAQLGHIWEVCFLTADWQTKFLSTKFSSSSQLCSSVPQHYTYWNEIRRNLMKKARHFLKQDPSGRNEICYPSFAGSLGINTKWKNIRKHKNFHNFDTLKRWFNRNVPLFSVWIVGVSWCVGTLVFWRSDFGIWKVWQWCYNVLSKVIHGVWSIACFYGLF